MKKFYTIILLLITGVMFFIYSCKKDTNNSKTPAEEVAGYSLYQSITNGNYTFFIYKNDAGALQTGYNQIYIQLKANAPGTYIENANLSWNPIMFMTGGIMNTPFSGIQKVPNTNTVYQGYIIFTMPTATDTPDMAGWWQITLAYLNSTNSQDTIVKAKKTIIVNNAPTINTSWFQFQNNPDSNWYLAALVNPINLKVGNNSTSVILIYQSGMNFTPITNYSIQVYPWMPGMTMNTTTSTLTYSTSAGLYQGDFNLSMTGVWRLNLAVLNAQNQAITAGPVSATSDSVYFQFNVLK